MFVSAFSLSVLASKKKKDRGREDKCGAVGGWGVGGLSDRGLFGGSLCLYVKS